METGLSLITTLLDVVLGVNVHVEVRAFQAI